MGYRSRDWEEREEDEKPAAIERRVERPIPPDEPCHDHGPEGIELVDIEAADFRGLPISGEYPRHGARLEDFEWSVTALSEVVMPGVERGMDRGDFLVLDNYRFKSLDESKHVPMRRYAHIYDLYYGSQHIVVHRENDNSLTVMDGRHRIEAARRLRILTLPGEVRGAVDADVSDRDHMEESDVTGSNSERASRIAETDDRDSDDTTSRSIDASIRDRSIEDDENVVPDCEQLGASERMAILNHLLVGLPHTSGELVEVYDAEYDPENCSWHVYLDEDFNRGDWDRHVHLHAETEDGINISKIGIYYTYRPIEAMIVTEMKKREALSNLVPEQHIRRGLDEVSELYSELISPQYQQPVDIPQRRLWQTERDKEGNSYRSFYRTYHKAWRLLDRNVLKLQNCDQKYMEGSLDVAREEIEYVAGRAIDAVGEEWLARGLKSGDEERKRTLKIFVGQLRNMVNDRRRS